MQMMSDEQIGKVTKKDDISPTELENMTKTLCLLEKIKDYKEDVVFEDDDEGGYSQARGVIVVECMTNIVAQVIGIQDIADVIHTIMRTATLIVIEMVVAIAVVIICIPENTDTLDIVSKTA